MPRAGRRRCPACAGAIRARQRSRNKQRGDSGRPDGSRGTGATVKHLAQRGRGRRPQPGHGRSPAAPTSPRPAGARPGPVPHRTPPAPPEPGSQGGGLCPLPPGPRHSHRRSPGSAAAPLRCPALPSARRAAALGRGGAGRGRERRDGSREGSTRALLPALLHLLPAPAPPPSPPRRRALSGSRPEREKEPRPLGECRPPPESRARGHREAQPPPLRWGETRRATGSSPAAGSARARQSLPRGTRGSWQVWGEGRCWGAEGLRRRRAPAGRRCAPWGGGQRSPVPPDAAANFLGVRRRVCREGSCCLPASPPASPRCRRPALPLSLPASLPPSWGSRGGGRGTGRDGAGAAPGRGGTGTTWSHWPRIASSAASPTNKTHPGLVFHSTPSPPPRPALCD